MQIAKLKAQGGEGTTVCEECDTAENQLVLIVPSAVHTFASTVQVPTR